MSTQTAKSSNASQRGVALLVAIFALLLISGVAISLILMAGTEAAIDGNYRGSTQAFYAAYSGLEEARGRLSKGHPNTFPAAFVPVYSGVLGVDQVRYVLNPSTGETVDPTDLTVGNPYRDTEYQQEFGVPVTSAVVTTTTSNSAVAGLAGPPYKWVRITAKTERSSNTDIDNHGAPPYDATTPVFFDGGNQNLASAGAQVFTLTSLAVLPGGSQRMLHYDVAPVAPIVVDAAIYTKSSQVMGQALNITGITDPVCTMPSTYGAKSGGTIATAGNGNVTGSPGAILPNTTFPYNVPALIKALKPTATPIDAPGTGVTGSGMQPVYTGPHATLGVPPTVTYNNAGGITSITAPGTPVIHHAIGDLILGTSVLGGAPVSGQGFLLVTGNLTIDITNGFNYFGLILVDGNIAFTVNPSNAASANIHGAIIGSGAFNASALANLSGGIFVRQNACMVQDLLNQQGLRILSFREVTQ